MNRCQKRREGKQCNLWDGHEEKHRFAGEPLTLIEALDAKIEARKKEHPIRAYERRLRKAYASGDVDRVLAAGRAYFNALEYLPPDPDHVPYSGMAAWIPGPGYKQHKFGEGGE